MNIKINNLDISNINKFAYDGCHKIYLEVKDTLLKYDIIADDDFIKKYTCQVEGNYWG